MRDTFESKNQEYSLDALKIKDLLEELQETIDQRVELFNSGNNINARDCMYIIDGKGVRKYHDVRDEYLTYEFLIGKTIRVDGEATDGNALFCKTYGTFIMTNDRISLKSQFIARTGLILDPNPIYDIIEKYVLEE